MARKIPERSIAMVTGVAFATVGLAVVVASLVGNVNPFDRLALVWAVGVYGVLAAAAVRMLSDEGTDDVDGSDDGSSDGRSGSVWDLIPRWQYLGRHYEGAGATRDEQERALERIEERAQHLEDEERRWDGERRWDEEGR